MASAANQMQARLPESFSVKSHYGGVNSVSDAMMHLCERVWYFVITATARYYRPVALFHHSIVSAEIAWCPGKAGRILSDVSWLYIAHEQVNMSHGQS